MPKYYTIKTFGNDRGLSCAFRQWRAVHSHCRFCHGYSIGVRFVLETNTLDDKNWCYDYGNFKWIKKFLEDSFDHKVAIAKDDPAFDEFVKLQELGVLELTIMPNGVGCERFAEYIFDYVAPKVLEETNNRVSLKSVEVFEHGANSAIYEG